MIKEETARAQPALWASTCEWRQQDTANGELETKTNTETNEEWAFQYDALGNLLSVALPNGDLVEYLVDGLGRRISKKKTTASNVVVLHKQWIYRDALKPVAELDGSGALVAEFVYGSKGNVPDYVRRGGNTYRVVSDHLGSPRYVVNATNSPDVPFQAEYSSFGEVLGTGLDWMPFGFAGGHHDPETRVVRFGRRDYDPQVGRWTTKDPERFEVGVNFFEYALSDPINLVDIDGRAPRTICFLAPFMCGELDWFREHRPSDLWDWLFGGAGVGPDDTLKMCGAPSSRDWSCTRDGLDRTNSPATPICVYTCHNSKTNELRGVRRYAIPKEYGARRTIGWACMPPEQLASILQ